MMGFEVSERAKEINERLEAFMEEHIYPRERIMTNSRVIKIIYGSIQIGMKS
jgi:hypothetical protein